MVRMTFLGGTWRIIPFSKWLLTMVCKSCKDRVVNPFQMANKSIQIILPHQPSTTRMFGPSRTSQGLNPSTAVFLVFDDLMSIGTA